MHDSGLMWPGEQPSLACSTACSFPFARAYDVDSLTHPSSDLKLLQQQLLNHQPKLSLALRLQAF